MPTDRLQAYLHTYAEPVLAWLDTNICQQLKTYSQVLVIPLYDEPLNCLEQVFPSNCANALVILVVNAALDAPVGARQRTQAFLAQFQPRGQRLTVLPQANSTLLLVDCCTPGRQLPPQQGVGLARKIGGDLALACIHHDIVQSPWIRCTDADAVLPANYFEATGELAARQGLGVASLSREPLSGSSGLAAILYPFTHRPLQVPILQYEISLRDYVAQLATAGSPYAFHTIGSLMMIQAEAYATVRGFPKRQAGEDFYMLNKLAKVGAILQLTTPTVTLSARISERVPFGTGAAMKKWTNSTGIALYNPAIFAQLQAWLRLIDRLWDNRLELGDWSRETDLTQVSIQALQQLGIAKILPQAYRQCSNTQHFRYFMAVWFDAFRTLKFVHGLRDWGYPSQTSLGGHSLAQLKALNQTLILNEKKRPATVGPSLFRK